MKKKNKILIYCCDYAVYRGEGILANNFKLALEKIFKDSIIKIYSPENNFFNLFRQNQKTINHSFFYKYFSPIFGIFKIWQWHFKGYRTAYVNFLPLWNLFLFIFLPKKTILGPITGGLYQGNNYNITTILRKIIVYTLYSISVVFIKIRNLKCIFSTKLLLSFLPKEIKNKAIFNFQLYNFLFFEKRKKFIDVLYYNRHHHTKYNNLILPILNKLKNQFNILIVGNKIDHFKNLGIISRKKMISILKKTRFIFSSPENQLSYFVLDAISCNAQIISLSNQKPTFFNNRFLFLKNFSEKKIKKILLSRDKKYSKHKLIRIIKNNNDKIYNFIKKNYEY